MGAAAVIGISLHRDRGGNASTVRGFDELGGPIVVVCGLHGGAGTTEVAVAVAAAAARASLPERVMLTETGDGLADTIGRRSPVGLATLGRSSARGEQTLEEPHVVTGHGLRLLTGDGRTTEPRGLRALIEQAGAHHGLLVIDAGTLRDVLAPAVLETADLVVWCARAERLATTLGRLDGPAARPARGAYWLLALAGRGRTPRKVDGLDGVVRTGHQGRVDEAQQDQLCARLLGPIG